MLKFSVLFLTSRKAMIEVEDFGIWNTNEPHEIWLNGEKYMESCLLYTSDAADDV